MSKKDEFIAEINRLKSARNNTKSAYLKRDYNKAIKKMEKELAIYNFYMKGGKAC